MAELDPRLAELFAEAAALPAGEREARLRARCHDEPELLAEVLALLASHDSADGFLDTPAALLWENGRAAAPLEFDGRYRLQEQLGEGAMGTVWRAEQLTPVRREVALKVMANELQGEAARARFHAEQQAVAVFDHPHIARLYESGTTADGRPWFAMELVSGEPLFPFCESHALGLEARIGLMVQVCRAVHHAHQKGVVHRDLKPSNVLVAMQDGQPAPRVIDFGVAKAVANEPGTTPTTAHGELLGTLEDMSPEQAGATADIDTRADIYSLGVMLYELAAGSLPFASVRLRQAPLAEALRIVREEEPPPLHRRGTGRQHELDWIVQKAMEKDRARRYASAAEFAEDLERLLRHEPVLARPTTTGYRLRKLLRRHRLAAIAVVAVVLSLVAGVVGTLVEAAHAREQRDLAQAAERQSARHLQQAVKGSGATITILGELMNNIAGATAVRRRQSETAVRLYEELAAMPGNELVADHERGYAWQRLGEAQLTMGEPEQALASFERGQALRERVLQGSLDSPQLRPLAVNHWKMSEALSALGCAAASEVHALRARELHLHFIALRKREPVDEAVYLGISLRRIGEHELEDGRYEAAGRNLGEALELVQAGLATNDPNPVMKLTHAIILLRLGDVRAACGERQQAEALYREAHEVARELGLRTGPVNVHERRLMVFCQLGLASLCAEQADHEGALATARSAETLARAIADADPDLYETHVLAARTLLPQARAQQALSRPAEALATVSRAQEQLAALVARAPDYAATSCELARACLLAADCRSTPGLYADAAEAVEARAKAAADRQRARELLQELQHKGRLPPGGKRLLAEAGG